MKIDGFSAKGAAQGHDTIIKYYWLAHQSKKKGIGLLSLPLRCATQGHSFDWLTDKMCAPGVFLPYSVDYDMRPLVQSFYWLANAVGGLDPHKRRHWKGKSQIGGRFYNKKTKTLDASFATWNWPFNQNFLRNSRERGLTWGLLAIYIIASQLATFS